MKIFKNLIHYGKLLHKQGLVIGSGGNISEKHEDTLIIKRKGALMYKANSENYLQIPFCDIDKSNDKLSSETSAHAACYSANKTIHAVIHTHSPYAIACANKAQLLKDVSYEFTCILKAQVPVLDFIQPGSIELANAIAIEIKKGATAVLLKQHGVITIGLDLEEAYLRALAIERAAITFLHM